MSTTRGPCPQCERGPNDRALATTTDERGTVLYCHRCGFVTSVRNEQSRIHLGGSKIMHRKPLDWSSRAESIWCRTQELRGTLGEIYLMHRGCTLPPRDSHLRFLSGNDRHPPTLCAAVTDVLSGKPISLHFTRLALDGRGKAGTTQDKILLAGHRKRGGCIRLWPDDTVTHGLALTEGIETGLAVAHAYAPTWAAIDCSNLASFPILDDVESLTIFADHDQPGLRAAHVCGHRWADAGCNVCIVFPKHEGTDFADVVNT